MATRLPPLNALRTFEAAARHLSFTKAAQELFVTQAAVSHQIKTLEEHLGVPLFRRLNRHLILTDQGQALLPSVRQAFDALSAGVERVHEQCCSGILTISTVPSLASRWLVGRLSGFNQRYPDIEVRLTTSQRLVDFIREGIDAGIRHGGGGWPGLQAERLFTAEMFPVCSPRLLEGPHPIRRPEDLAHHTLLHALDSPGEWRIWLLAAGVKGIDPERGPKFDSSALTVQAALGGAGVAMVTRPLVSEDLAAGRLVMPFELELPRHTAYYFVAPSITWDQPKIAAFREWLLDEVAASPGTNRAAAEGRMAGEVSGAGPTG